MGLTKVQRLVKEIAEQKQNIMRSEELVAKLQADQGLQAAIAATKEKHEAAKLAVDAAHASYLKAERAVLEAAGLYKPDTVGWTELPEGLEARIEAKLGITRKAAQDLWANGQHKDPFYDIFQALRRKALLSPELEPARKAKDLSQNLCYRAEYDARTTSRPVTDAGFALARAQQELTRLETALRAAQDEAAAKGKFAALPGVAESKAQAAEQEAKRFALRQTIQKILDEGAL